MLEICLLFYYLPMRYALVYYNFTYENRNLVSNLKDIKKYDLPMRYALIHGMLGVIFLVKLSIWLIKRKKNKLVNNARPDHHPSLYYPPQPR